MILASCTENDAGPGAKGAHAVISLAEGGTPLSLYSSSLVSVFRVVRSSTRLSLRIVPALRAYIARTAPTEGTSYILQDLIAWKDIIRSLEMLYAPPGPWEVSSIRKTRNPHSARLLLRQVLLSVVGQLLVPHPKRNALDSPIRYPPSTPFKKAEKTSTPRIIITPPPAEPLHQESVNAVPTPQDAAFGNQLIVPDPEFTVINSSKGTEVPFTDRFKVDEFGSVADDPYASFGGCASPSWGDPEDSDDMVKCALEEREEDDDDACTLGLGPTWSG